MYIRDLKIKGVGILGFKVIKREKNTTLVCSSCSSLDWLNKVQVIEETNQRKEKAWNVSIKMFHLNDHIIKDSVLQNDF